MNVNSDEMIDDIRNRLVADADRLLVLIHKERRLKIKIKMERALKWILEVNRILGAII